MRTVEDARVAYRTDHRRFDGLLIVPDRHRGQRLGVVPILLIVGGMGDRAGVGLDRDRELVLADLEEVAVGQDRLMLFNAIDAATHVRAVVEPVTPLAEDDLHLPGVMGGPGADDERLLARDGQGATSDCGGASGKVQRHGGRR